MTQHQIQYAYLDRLRKQALYISAIIGSDNIEYELQDLYSRQEIFNINDINNQIECILSTLNDVGNIEQVLNELNGGTI